MHEVANPMHELQRAGFRTMERALRNFLELENNRARLIAVEGEQVEQSDHPVLRTTLRERQQNITLDFMTGLKDACCAPLTVSGRFSYADDPEKWAWFSEAELKLEVDLGQTIPSDMRDTVMTVYGEYGTYQAAYRDLTISSAASG